MLCLKIVAAYDINSWHMIQIWKSKVCLNKSVSCAMKLNKCLSTEAMKLIFDLMCIY